MRVFFFSQSLQILPNTDIALNTSACLSGKYYNNTHHATERILPPWQYDYYSTAVLLSCCVVSLPTLENTSTLLMISCFVCTHSNNCPYCSHISCYHCSWYTWFSGNNGSLFVWDMSGIGYLEGQCTVTKLQQKWSVWHSLLHRYRLHCPGICQCGKPHTPSLQPATSSQTNHLQPVRWCSSGPCN